MVTRGSRYYGPQLDPRIYLFLDYHEEKASDRAGVGNPEFRRMMFHPVAAMVFRELVNAFEKGLPSIIPQVADWITMKV